MRPSKRMMKRKDFDDIVARRYGNIKEHLLISDGGKTITNRSPYALSPGCQACKRGSWLCLYVGFACNADCDFCTQEHIHGKDNGLIDGHDPQTIIQRTVADKSITGVSFSGGEPLLYLEDKVIPVAQSIKLRRPDIYMWIYTNGKLITAEILHILKEAGIKEIRINLAATRFDRRVMDKIPLAKDIIGKVTVEVPSIPMVKEKLLDEGIIHLLVKLGVQQLNLAELITVHPRTKKFVEEEFYVRWEKGNTQGLLTPVRSRNITIDVMEYVIRNDLPLLVNDCSHDAKGLQKKLPTA